MNILVAGSDGLNCREVCRSLAARGRNVRRFDISRSSVKDVRRSDQLLAAVSNVDGAVNLAAVSRVVWGKSRTPRVREALCGIRTTILERERGRLRALEMGGNKPEINGDRTVLSVLTPRPAKGSTAKVLQRSFCIAPMMDWTI